MIFSGLLIHRFPRSMVRSVPFGTCVVAKCKNRKNSALLEFYLFYYKIISAVFNSYQPKNISRHPDFD